MEGPSGYQKDGAVLSALQKLRFFPQMAVRGAGCRLQDDTGRWRLDFSASWGAASLGYAHPEWTSRVTEALNRQAGASVLSGANAAATQLAERLLEITPGADDRRIWLGHSGSDANETVARAVAVATGRPRILAFEGAYHGGTAGSMAVSGHPAQAHAARSGHLTLLPFPDPKRPFEGDASGKALLQYFENLLRDACPGEDVAALFIEPILSDGGLIVPPPGFLSGLAGICSRYGILTVCDEVKVGLGRTGRLHCFEHENFIPDIVVFGKGLGGGLPVSAIVGPADILNFAQAFSMQTTHGNPVCATAALAVLDAIEAEHLAANAERAGGHLINILRGALQSRRQNVHLRGRGLAIGLELTQDDGVTPDPALARQTVFRAWELGLIAYYVGTRSNVIELTPPLVLSRAEGEEGAEMLVQALCDAQSGKVSESALSDFRGW